MYFHYDRVRLSMTDPTEGGAFTMKWQDSGAVVGMELPELVESTDQIAAPAGL
jgi:hypothetical protein